MNPALQWAPDRVYSCSSAASQSLASYDCVLVKKSRAALVLLQGQRQETPLAVQIFSIQEPLHHHPFAVEQLRQP